MQNISRIIVIGLLVFLVTTSSCTQESPAPVVCPQCPPPPEPVQCPPPPAPILCPQYAAYPQCVCPDCQKALQQQDEYKQCQELLQYKIELEENRNRDIAERQKAKSVEDIKKQLKADDERLRKEAKYKEKKSNIINDLIKRIEDKDRDMCMCRCLNHHDIVDLHSVFNSYLNIPLALTSGCEDQYSRSRYKEEKYANSPYVTLCNEICGDVLKP